MEAMSLVFKMASQLHEPRLELSPGFRVTDHRYSVSHIVIEKAQ